MRKIANIITDGKFYNDLIYNVIDSNDGIIKGIPTLCVGVGLTKRLFPNFSIIDMDIDNMTKWTYGPREKRNLYENRLKEFIHYSIENLKKNIVYKYINVIVNGLDSLDFKKFLGIISDSDKKATSYISNGVAYVYDNNRFIYGVSLRELSYIGKDEKKFLKYIYKNSSVITNKDVVNLGVGNFFYGCEYLFSYVFSDYNKNDTE